MIKVIQITLRWMPNIKHWTTSSI